MSSFLTRREVADALATTPRMLRQLERAGIGPRPTRLGPRTARYAPNAVAEFAALKREALTSPTLSAPAEVVL